MDFLARPEIALTAYWNHHPTQRPRGYNRGRIEVGFALYGQLKMLENIPTPLLELAQSELGSFVQTFLNQQELSPVVDLYSDVLEWYNREAAFVRH